MRDTILQPSLRLAAIIGIAAAAGALGACALKKPEPMSAAMEAAPSPQAQPDPATSPSTDSDSAWMDPANDAPASEPVLAVPAAETSPTSETQALAREFEASCALVSLDESTAGVLIGKKMHSLRLGGSYLVAYRGRRDKLRLESIDLDAPKAELTYLGQPLTLTMDFTDLQSRLASGDSEDGPKHEKIKVRESDSYAGASAPGPADQKKKSAVVYGFSQTVSAGAKKAKPGQPSQPISPAQASQPPGQPAGAGAAQPASSAARSRERRTERSTNRAAPTPYAFQPINPAAVQQPVSVQQPVAINPNNDPATQGAAR